MAAPFIKSDTCLSHVLANGESRQLLSTVHQEFSGQEKGGLKEWLQFQLDLIQGDWGSLWRVSAIMWTEYLKGQLNQRFKG